MFILPLMLRERKEGKAGNVYIAFNVTGKEGRQEMFILPLMLRQAGNVYIAFNVTGKAGNVYIAFNVTGKEGRQEMFILPLMLRERKEGRKCLYCL